MGAYRSSSASSCCSTRLAASVRAHKAAAAGPPRRRGPADPGHPAPRRRPGYVLPGRALARLYATAASPPTRPPATAWPGTAGTAGSPAWQTRTSARCTAGTRPPPARSPRRLLSRAGPVPASRPAPARPPAARPAPCRAPIRSSPPGRAAHRSESPAFGAGVLCGQRSAVSGVRSPVEDRTSVLCRDSGSRSRSAGTTRPAPAGRQAHPSDGRVLLMRPGRCSASDFTIRSISRRISALNGPASSQ